MTSQDIRDGSLTAVIVARGNLDMPCAGTLCRLGYCHGFSQIGVRAQLVNAFEIEHILPQLHRPFVFLSVYDYLDMSEVARKMLRDYQHFVWVDPDYEAIQEIYTPYGITRPRLPQEVSRYVLDSGPDFVWAPVPPSALGVFSYWQQSGLRLESLLLACDTGRYYPEPYNLKYSKTKMAYVGGYWPKKAIQFDKYLRPYEDTLAIFGYNFWPYKGYRGLLQADDERVLYQNASVCPAISEPDVVQGHITERTFKIMGSGGLAVTDIAPIYRELFTEDELLVPESIDEYHDMIHQALSDDEFGRGFRERGRLAILERHTYAHRAREILDHLNISKEDREYGKITEHT